MEEIDSLYSLSQQECTSADEEEIASIHLASKKCTYSFQELLDSPKKASL